MRHAADQDGSRASRTRDAVVYAQLGNSELALKALDRTDALSANSKNLSLRGYILARSGHADQAEDVLRALKRNAREG